MPGIQAGGYKLSLTEAQRKKLVEEGVLELSDEQYTGGVRHQVESVRKRATKAERKLGETAWGRPQGTRGQLARHFPLLTPKGADPANSARKPSGTAGGNSGPIGQFP